MELILTEQKRHSFADYLSWADEARRELFDGLARLMSAPGRRHQKVSGRLFYTFYNHLRGKPCEVYSAPFDVRLPRNGETRDEQIFTVLQPDLVAVCDLAKLDEKGCLGAPDLVVEISSKSTGTRDFKDKFAIYERSGVREYWIVLSEMDLVQQFVLDGEGKFRLQRVGAPGDSLRSHVLPELEVDLREVFAE